MSKFLSSHIDYEKVDNKSDIESNKDRDKDIEFENIESYHEISIHEKLSQIFILKCYTKHTYTTVLLCLSVVFLFMEQNLLSPNLSRVRTT
jgi:hypothetical protein